MSDKWNQLFDEIVERSLLADRLRPPGDDDLTRLRLRVQHDREVVVGPRLGHDRRVVRFRDRDSG